MDLFVIFLSLISYLADDIPHLTEQSTLEETEVRFLLLLFSVYQASLQPNRAALACQSNPQAIANLVSFLVSEDAHHVTGEYIPC